MLEVVGSSVSSLSLFLFSKTFATVLTSLLLGLTSRWRIMWPRQAPWHVSRAEPQIDLTGENLVIFLNKNDQTKIVNGIILNGS